MRILQPIKMQNTKKNMEYNQNLIGKDVEVLFEEKNKEGYYKGHTQNYILVEFKTDEEVENKIVKVNVKKAPGKCENIFLTLFYIVCI